MMSSLFGIMPQGHLDFAGQMQGAMGDMWKVNSANQQASLANKALGGGLGGAGGRGGAGRSPGLWDAFLGFNLADPSQASAYGGARKQIRGFKQEDFQDQWQQNQMMLDQKYNDFQRKLPLLSRLFGFGGGGGGFGSGPLGYTTNFGAYGNG